MPYDEFGLFSENVAEYDLPYDGPPIVRRVETEVGPDRRVSSLLWGDKSPELVLVHGGAQNAHTWDTVAMALRRPLLAIDLPGHGHSDGGPDGSLSVRSNGADLAAVITELAPNAKGVVGMSLGGLSSIALTAQAPELVRKLALIDVTPGVNPEKSAPITAFIDGPASFDSFDALLERTIEHNPSRTVASLRRGILHNAVQREDGTWVWRYARFRAGEARQRPEFENLWDAVSGIGVPLLLVRGLAWSVVDDADVEELMRRQPDATVIGVEGAGHSIQGDRPLELAAILSDFFFRDPELIEPPFIMWFSRRSIALHVVIVIIVPTFAALCFWQVHRALDGNSLSWAYVFEWPFFAGYAVYMWWRFVHEVPVGQQPARPPATSIPSTSTAASSTEQLAEDADRAAYNEYLASLADHGKRKDWR